MAKIKNFTAKIFSGTKGFVITVAGEVNCGMLTVQPQLEEKVPQGINPAILQYTATPASDAHPENFQKASASKNLTSEDQYKKVEIFDPHGNSLEMIPVTKE